MKRTKTNGRAVAGHPIPIRFPQELEDKVRREAVEEGLSMSAWVRRLVIRHFAASERGAA